MISFVDGTVAAVSVDGAVVAVGGVGLAVQCTPATLATLRVGEFAHLPTSLVVREDSLTLFGFADEDERSVFTLLQTASGVGPRLALAMLGTLSPNDLRRAVATSDLKALTQVPGIGQKGAQRIILELKDRLGLPLDTGGGSLARAGWPPPVGPVREGWQEQVAGALINLGWTSRDADAAIKAVAGQAGDPPDVAALLRAALRSLSRA